MKRLRVLLLVALCQCCLGNNCPLEEDLKPHCWCLESFHGGALFCEDISNPTELEAPVHASQGHNVTALGIFNSTLLYFPHDIFKGTVLAKITLVDTVLMSLSNGPLAFEGLEDSLLEFRTTQAQYVTQWRFSQLRQLRKLVLIDINWVHMESIEEQLPEFPEMTALGLIHAGISYIVHDAFAKFPKLWVLDLRHNHISELKRSMLPNPASKLTILNLEDNELSTLPSDFFTNMPSLADVYLSKNQFVTIQEDVFGGAFKQLLTLDMRENMFKCDCRMLWLLTQRQPVNMHAKCVAPPSLEGQEIKYLTTKSIRC